MSRKSRAAERKRKQELRDQKNSKKNRYKEMTEKGLLGKMEIQKYHLTIKNLSKYKFMEDSLIYSQLKKIENPKRNHYDKLNYLYNLVVRNRRYDPWIDEEF
jgi:hypothetical protein